MSMFIPLLPLPYMPAPIFLGGNMAAAGEIETLIEINLPEATSDLEKFEQHMTECFDCAEHGCVDHHFKQRADLLYMKCAIEERIDTLVQYMGP